MKNKIIISTIMALSLTVCGSAFAKDNDRGNGHGRNGHSQNNGHGSDRGHDNRSDYRGKHARSHDNGRHEGRGRGAGPRHDFYKGNRISHEYRSRQYVVNDWRGHHLHAPPRGYHWVQTGPDYVLIAITTGIIAQIVLSN